VTCSRWWRWGESNSTLPVSSVRGQEAVGGATCGFSERLVTAPARCYPRFTRRLRTQHGPTRGVPVPSARGRLGRSGPPRSGPDWPAGHGKADSQQRTPGGLACWLRWSPTLVAGLDRDRLDAR
jgi:hypothetical protein